MVNEDNLHKFCAIEKISIFVMVLSNFLKKIAEFCIFGYNKFYE